MSDRMSAAFGLLFAIAFVVWILLLGAVEPGGGQPRPTDVELRALFSDARRMGAARVAAFLASSLLVLFAAHVHIGEDGRATARSLVAVPTAVGLALVLLVGTGVVTGAADTLRRGEELEASTAHALWDVAGGVFGFMPYLAAAFLLAAATRTRPVLARVAPVVAGMLVLGGISYDLVPGDPLWPLGILAMVMWLAWIVATSIALLRSDD